MKNTTQAAHRKILLMAFLPSALISVVMCSFYLFIRFSELDNELISKAESMGQRASILTAFAMETRQFNNVQSLMSLALEDKGTRGNQPAG